jgi:hypothetical protein
LLVVPSGGGVTELIAGAFGTAAPEAVVSVPLADHALPPAEVTPWTWTSYAVPAVSPDNSYGLVTFGSVVQAVAPEGLNHRLNPVAALCPLSTAGAAQVTARSLPEPCARDGADGAFEIWVAGGCGGVGVDVAALMRAAEIMVAGARFLGVRG